MQINYNILCGLDQACLDFMHEKKFKSVSQSVSQNVSSAVSHLMRGSIHVLHVSNKPFVNVIYGYSPNFTCRLSSPVLKYCTFLSKMNEGLL